MDIKMHDPRCCIYSVEEGGYPNHLQDIINDPTLEWRQIRCEADEKVDNWERWYEISSPEKRNLYAKATTSSGSGGAWGTLTIYWGIPKSISSISKGWSDQCKGID